MKGSRYSAELRQQAIAMFRDYRASFSVRSALKMTSDELGPSPNAIWKWHRDAIDAGSLQQFVPLAQRIDALEQRLAILEREVERQRS